MGVRVQFNISHGQRHSKITAFPVTLPNVRSLALACARSMPQASHDFDWPHDPHIGNINVLLLRIGRVKSGRGRERKRKKKGSQYKFHEEYASKQWCIVECSADTSRSPVGGEAVSSDWICFLLLYVMASWQYERQLPPLVQHLGLFIFRKRTSHWSLNNTRKRMNT